MRFALALPLLAVAGCGVFHTMHEDHTGQQHTPPSAPRATATATLTAHPTPEQLTAHYCASLATEGSLARAAATTCRGLGAAPAPSDLSFQSRVALALTSSNPVSVTVTSVLLRVTAFPDSAERENTSALCITLCTPHASTCPQDPHGCDGAAEGTESFASVPALADHRFFHELEQVILRPHADAALAVTLDLASEPLLALLGRVDGAAMDAVRAGHAPTYAIPYAIEGTVWIASGTSTTASATIPRATGTWDVAAQ
jgi:hypothetical protein